MIFSEIAEILKNRCKCSVNIGKADPELTHFAFLSDGMALDDPSCLYIGNISTLAVKAESSLVCLLTTNRGLPSDVSYILTDDDELMNCMNALTSAFFRSIDSESRFMHLVSLSQENVSIDELINKAALFLNRSLILTDLGFKVLAHSTSVTITDPLWVRYVRDGSCSFEFINAMNELMPAQSLPKTSECFRVTCSRSTEEKLCSQLFISGRPVAYLVILDNNRGLSGFHSKYLPGISEFLSAYISRNNTYPDLLMNDADFYVRLLEASDEDIKEIVKKSPAHNRGLFCMVFKAIHHSRHELFFIKRTLDSLISGNVIFIYKELVVVISSDKESIYAIEKNEELLRNVSEVGVSSEFDDASLFPENFQYAQEACRIGRQTGRDCKIHKYEDYRFLHLLNHVSDVHLMRSYIHPSLLSLHEYDLEHDSELVRTLRVYLENSCSVKDSSGVLFLHRNTLKYRVEKIVEVTGLDLSSASTIFRLVCSYQINDLLHLF